MTNKEKFLALVSEKDNHSTLEKIKWRIENRAMLRESQKIALKVLLKLDELGWKQADLAREMGVSPQQITKIVSGKENLSIATQVKLQDILNIPVLASFYENKMKQAEDIVFVQSGETVKYEPAQQQTKICKKELENLIGKGSLSVVYNGFIENKEVA
jgi:transcriptional regulator with XRE-family HTH domain